MGITISVFQASLLTGSIKLIYLYAACASSIIEGIASGVIVSYINNLEAEAGMFGPYWESGLSIAILVAILIYGLATSTILFVFWRDEKR
jgi:hypothetical protein